MAKSAVPQPSLFSQTKAVSQQDHYCEFEHMKKQADAVSSDSMTANQSSSLNDQSRFVFMQQLTEVSLAEEQKTLAKKVSRKNNSVRLPMSKTRSSI